MRASVAILAGSAALAHALTQQCTGKAHEENGNWYCGEVEHIQYGGVGDPGKYQAVTSMDTGGCGWEDVSFSGALAPLDEGVSHSRGGTPEKQLR